MLHAPCGRFARTRSSSGRAAASTAAAARSRPAAMGAAGAPTAPPAAAASATSAPPQQLDNAGGLALLQRLDTVLLDCDGVLWRGNTLIPNAVDALHVMRAAGKRLLFCTNNSSKSRAEYVSKLAALGIDVAAEEIVSSSFTAAAYLQSAGFAGSGKRALLLGSSGMADELRAAGIAVVDAAALQLPLLDSVDAMLQLQLDERIGAVVLGWDAAFSYSRLVYACACLRELPGCIFVASNLDHADRIGDGQRLMPGTGALVAALATAAGMQPVDCGKGGAWLFPFLMQRYALDPTRTAVVGDRLDTDIAMGKQGGLVTILPLTGVTSMEQAAAAGPAEAPDFIVESVALLGGCG